MPEPRAIIRNWRDVDPYVGHESAVIWAILGRQNEDSQDPHDCLQHLSGFARHSLQGHKNSDHHQHEGAEQYYYILSGGGEVLIGDQRHPVSEGSINVNVPLLPQRVFGNSIAGRRLLPRKRRRGRFCRGAEAERGQHSGHAQERIDGGLDR